MRIAPSDLGRAAFIVVASALVLILWFVLTAPEVRYRDQIHLAHTVASRLDHHKLEIQIKAGGRRFQDAPLIKELEGNDFRLWDRLGYLVEVDGIEIGSIAIFVPIGFDSYIGYDVYSDCWDLDGQSVTTLPLCAE